MAKDFGTVFSTFFTLGKYYIRRALSEVKCSASEAMTGIGREGKGNSRAFNLKIYFKYPFWPPPEGAANQWNEKPHPNAGGLKHLAQKILN